MESLTYDPAAHVVRSAGDTPGVIAAHHGFDDLASPAADGAAGWFSIDPGGHHPFAIRTVEELATAASDPVTVAALVQMVAASARHALKQIEPVARYDAMAVQARAAGHAVKALNRAAMQRWERLDLVIATDVWSNVMTLRAEEDRCMICAAKAELAASIAAMERTEQRRADEQVVADFNETFDRPARPAAEALADVDHSALDRFWERLRRGGHR